MNKKRFYILLFTLAFWPGLALLARGDQMSSERYLNENRFFINFINVCITNFGSQEEIQIFKKASKHNFWAKVSFLKSEYKWTYKEVRKSQNILVDLYKRTVDIYLQDTKKILDRIAPTIIRSQDSKAKLYLSLGYRDLTGAKSQQVIGLHSSKHLYSYKIKRYQESIKLSRRGKRYAILAILHSRTPRSKTQEVNKLSYEEIGAKLRQMQKQKDKLVLPKYNLILHHVDNNQKTIKDKTIKDTIEKQFKVKGFNPNLTAEEKVDINE